MPVFRKDGRNILFVHVPKAGGSSIEQIFGMSGYQVLFRDPKTGPTSVNNLRSCSPQHMHAQMLIDNFRVEKFDLIFMVTREPLARFKSEYGMRESEKLEHHTPVDVERWARRAFDRYRKDAFFLDNHLRPQSEFQLHGSLIYRLEDGLDRVVENLNARFALGLRPAIPKVMDRKATSGTYSKNVQISPALERRIKEFYHQDFTTFGYPL